MIEWDGDIDYDPPEYLTCPRCGNDMVPQPPAANYDASDVIDMCGCDF